MHQVLKASYEWPTCLATKETVFQDLNFCVNNTSGSLFKDHPFKSSKSSLKRGMVLRSCTWIHEDTGCRNNPPPPPPTPQKKPNNNKKHGFERVFFFYIRVVLLGFPQMVISKVVLTSTGGVSRKKLLLSSSTVHGRIKDLLISTCIATAHHAWQNEGPLSSDLYLNSAPCMAE